MDNMKNTFNWIEIPVTDFDRAKKFYSSILNFDMPQEQIGSDLMGFFPYDQENECVGGAIVKGDMHKPSKEGTLAYLNGGENLNTILNKVESSGGGIVVPKTQISPEIGYFAIFADTEGNHIALHSKG